jgi:hypothetical protein
MEVFCSQLSAPHLTADTIHASICSLVVAQAEAGHMAWKAYAQAFLSPTTQDAVSALLPSSVDDVVEEAEAQGEPAEVATMACELCASALPLISLSIACVNGTSFPLRVPTQSLIWAVKQAIGKVGGSGCSIFQPSK